MKRRLNLLPRRAILLSITLGVPTIVGGWGVNSTSLSARPISTNKYQIHPTGGDQTSAINSMLRRAKASGAVVSFSPGDYLVSDTLRLDGVSVIGGGPDLVRINVPSVANREDPADGWVCLTGDGSQLCGLSIVGRNTHGRGRGGGTGVQVLGASNFRVCDLNVRNVNGCGVYIQSGSNGEVSDCFVENTGADGFHVTGGSHDILMKRLRAESSGDDSFATVSYRSQGVICNNIIWIDLVSNKSKARGISVVGGKYIRIINALITQSNVAGLYIWCEGSYDTFGNEDVRVERVTLQDCVTSSTVVHDNVMVGGRFLEIIDHTNKIDATAPARSFNSSPNFESKEIFLNEIRIAGGDNTHTGTGLYINEFTSKVLLSKIIIDSLGGVKTPGRKLYSVYDKSGSVQVNGLRATGTIVHLKGVDRLAP